MPKVITAFNTNSSISLLSTGSAVPSTSACGIPPPLYLSAVVVMYVDGPVRVKGMISTSNMSVCMCVRLSKKCTTMI